MISPKRKLAYVYLDLPHHEQVRIMKELGVYEASDDDTIQPEIYVTWMKRVRKQGKLPKLAEMLGVDLDPKDEADVRMVEDKGSGFLEVGTTGEGEVIINHPDIDPDKDGYGHIVFSPREALQLARLLTIKAKEAEMERK